MKILLSILTMSPVDTTIQLVKNIHQLEPDASVLLHINYTEDYNISKTKITEAIPDSNNWLFFNPKQIPTSRCYIAQALLSNMEYAYKNLVFDYYCMLPFNCLMVRSGLTSYIQENPADIYCYYKEKTNKNVPFYQKIYNKITTGSGKAKWTPSRWYRKSILAKSMLKAYNVDGYLYESFHEGLCLKKEVLTAFIPLLKHKGMKGLLSKKHAKYVRINNFLKLYFLYPYIAEEVIFATIIKYLEHKKKYSVIPLQFCYLNWNKAWIEENWNGITTAIKNKNHIFFYKWVATNPKDATRLEIITKTKNLL